MYKYKDLSAQSVRELLKKGVPKKLSIEGLWTYFLSGAVQEPFTFIDGVFGMAAELPRLGNLSAVNADEKTQERVTKAVEMAIAKTGCKAAFLSGGIDSSAIVAVLRRLYPDEEIRTYCVVHDDPRTDEREWARLVAKKNRTKHTEFHLSDEMIKSEVRIALQCYDEPSVDGINNYFASKFVSEAGEKVILSGEGGDELFAGYGQFYKARQAYRMAGRVRKVPGAAIFGRLLTHFSKREKLKKLGQLASSCLDPYFLTRRQFDEAWISRLLVDGFPKPNVEAIYKRIQEYLGTSENPFAGDAVNRASLMELRHNLRSMYLRDGIQTSAPFGLEIKAPLMDEELVNLVLPLPGNAKCDERISKPLLVVAAKGGIPDECIFRKKQGFALPFDKYFREGLKDELDAFVSGGTGLFRKKEIQKMWAGYLAGEVSWMRIWQCFAIDLWLQEVGVSIG